MDFCMLVTTQKNTNFYKREFHILAGILLVYLSIGSIISHYFMITGQGGSVSYSLRTCILWFFMGTSMGNIH